MEISELVCDLSFLILRSSTGKCFFSSSESRLLTRLLYHTPLVRNAKHDLSLQNLQIDLIVHPRISCECGSAFECDVCRTDIFMWHPHIIIQTRSMFDWITRFITRTRFLSRAHRDIR